MLRRKFATYLEDFLQRQLSINESTEIGLDGRKILLVNGARQIGKSYLIRYVGKKMFKNYVEIDLREDKEHDRNFADVRSTEAFYIQLSAIAGDRLNNRHDTLVFLDEIQSYPHLLTLLKFLNQEGKYTYVASGSQLGVALAQTSSVPIGSVEIQQMYPLDFEEFLWAMNCGNEAIDSMRQSFVDNTSLSEPLHNYMMRMFKYYLFVGGLPDAVNRFVEDKNVQLIRSIQNDVHTLYGIDASQYDKEHSLKIRKIYDLLPSNLENKKKRIIVKKIENKAGKQFSDYEDEFEYLIQSGIALEVRAISNPNFPLIASETKNLLKLYMNDVGIFTSLLFELNVNAILQENKGVNMGSVYESVVAQELHAHGFKLHYYDNKKHGEVDFLVDDYNSLSVLPIEVKSGKNYKEHSALDTFLTNKDYNIHRGIVFCNQREVQMVDSVIYMPIYYCMFLQKSPQTDIYLPILEKIES